MNTGWLWKCLSLLLLFFDATAELNIHDALNGYAQYIIWLEPEPLLGT